MNFKGDTARVLRFPFQLESKGTAYPVRLSRSPGQPQTGNKEVSDGASRGRSCEGRRNRPELRPGDFILFGSDVDHAIGNPGGDGGIIHAGPVRRRGQSGAKSEKKQEIPGFDLQFPLRVVMLPDIWFTVNEMRLTGG